MTSATADSASAIELRRKRHILRVVAAVVAEEGFSGATMRKIAERAGVSTGMLTYYYQSKRDLLMDMVAKTYEGFVRRLNEITEESAGPERIRACFNVMLEGSSSGQFPLSFWLAYFAEAARDGVLQELTIAGIQQLRSILHTALEHGVAGGELRPDLDLASATDLLTVLWQGIRVEVGLYGMTEERAAEVVAFQLRLLGLDQRHFRARMD